MITVTDCFLDNSPKLYGASTGVVQFPIRTEPVTQIHDLVDCLTGAGWSQVAATNSTATQVRIGLFIPVDPGSSSPPVEMPSHACTDSFFLQDQFQVNGVNFVMYASSSSTPPSSCGALNSNVFIPLGLTQNGTAANIAGAISSKTDFNAVFVGTSPPDWIVGAGFEFLLTSKIGIDADLEDISIGAGDLNSSGGYYDLQSQTLNGGYLTVRLQTHIHGAYTDSIVITVTALNGGTYQQEFYPGQYAVAANPYQFVIWPIKAGTLLSGIGPHLTFIEAGFTCSMLVSMLWTDPKHVTAPNPVLVIGSTSFYFNPNQLQDVMNWQNTLATGLDTTLIQTTLRTNVSSVDFGPSVIFHGLRGAELDDLSGAPLVQAPYVALSNNPGGSTTSIIAGKLWDMIVVSGKVGSLNGTATFAGNIWTELCSDSNLSDLFGSIWVLGG